MSPLTCPTISSAQTRHPPCSQLCSLSSCSGLQEGTPSAIPWSKQLESLTQTGLKASDVDVCPLPGSPRGGTAVGDLRN